MCDICNTYTTCKFLGNAQTRAVLALWSSLSCGTGAAGHRNAAHTLMRRRKRVGAKWEAVDAPEQERMHDGRA